MSIKRPWTAKERDKRRQRSALTIKRRALARLFVTGWPYGNRTGGGDGDYNGYSRS